MVKAFGIFSGGLDSILAAKVIMEQRLTPTLITFTSPYFTAEKALEGGKFLGLEPVLVDLSADLLPLIKKPKRSRGRNLNPCIDCHALMFNKAGSMLEQSGARGFIFSGEVLGQRPLSQNKNALALVADDSGFADLILRPLSARFLPPTLAEREGWINRDQLPAISGRGRQAQMELAKKFGLDKYPTPAGGCLLTDELYSRRLAWLLALPQAAQPDWPPAGLQEIIKNGRLFSAEAGHLVVVGRNQRENDNLIRLAGPDDIRVHLDGRPGPTVLVPCLGRPPGQTTLDMAQGLTAAYGLSGRDGFEAGATVALSLVWPGGERRQADTVLRRPEFWLDLMIK